MDRNEILNAIASLAHSQGFYGRLYRDLTNGSEWAEMALTDLENQKFENVVDMVLYIEC